MGRRWSCARAQTGNCFAIKLRAVHITTTDPNMPGCVACCKMPTDGALCRALVLVLLADAPGTRSGGSDALALLLRNQRRAPGRSALANRLSLRCLRPAHLTPRSIGWVSRIQIPDWRAGVFRAPHRSPWIESHEYRTAAVSTAGKPAVKFFLIQIPKTIFSVTLKPEVI